MIKRKLKTDEQLYIDWASEVPNWLEEMPLTKGNLERYKKTMDFTIRRLGDRLGVFADTLMDTPEIKALQKELDKAKTSHPSAQKSETCSEE